MARPRTHGKGRRARTQSGQLGLEALLWSKVAISPDELNDTGEWPTGRNGIFTACHTGEIENFRNGKRIIIPTAPLRRKLGIDGSGSTGNSVNKPSGGAK
jgi:hypothetical protein